MTLLRLPRIPSALCALAAVTLAPLNGWSQEPALQVDWFQSPINGHWYGVDYTPRTWTDSEALAVSLGGHLATIRSQDEQDWIAQEFGPYNLDQGLWIGFNDAAVEGTFVWSSGEPVTYDNWGGVEPNDAGGEDYAFRASNPSIAWGWADQNNSGNAPTRATLELPVQARAHVELANEPSVGGPQRRRPLEHGGGP